METPVSKKELTVISVLMFILVSVSLGMFWDLYAKNMICTCNCSQKVEQTQSEKPARPTESTKSATISPMVGTANRAETATSRTTTSATVPTATYSKCLQNTKDNPACKDCCDCLDGDASVHKTCRDACATNDFTKNSTYETFAISSKLGRSGDYSKCLGAGTEQSCKECCELPNQFACGDFQFCRTACATLEK